MLKYFLLPLCCAVLGAFVCREQLPEWGANLARFGAMAYVGLYLVGIAIFAMIACYTLVAEQCDEKHKVLSDIITPVRFHFFWKWFGRLLSISYIVAFVTAGDWWWLAAMSIIVLWPIQWAVLEMARSMIRLELEEMQIKADRKKFKPLYASDLNNIFQKQ